MPRRLVAVNVVLAAMSAVLSAYTARQLVRPTPLPVGGRRAVAAAPAAPVLETPPAPPGAYQVVAARNLFSPARAEGPSAVGTAALSPLVRPNLYGIVVGDNGSVAYLEDPATKRVVGYRIGDKIVGGTVQTIKADGVVIERPEGPVDVRLRDPNKPRAAQGPGQPGGAQVGAVQPGGLQPTPPLPGVIPPAASPQAPQVAQPQAPAQPQGQMQGVPPPAGQAPVIMPPGVRRPLPPNLLRRVPPGMSDAPRQ
jgi:hypothetical protein